MLRNEQFMSNFEQGTIKFAECENVAEQNDQQTGKKISIDVLMDRCKDLLAKVRGWYSRPSEAYSTVVGQEISPKSVVRVNVLTVMLIVMVMCAMQNVVVTGVSSACVGWIVYHAKREKTPNSPAKKKGGK